MGNVSIYIYIYQTWGQILLKVFKYKYKYLFLNVFKYKYKYLFLNVFKYKYKYIWKVFKYKYKYFVQIKHDKTVYVDMGVEMCVCVCDIKCQCIKFTNMLCLQKYLNP